MKTRSKAFLSVCVLFLACPMIVPAQSPADRAAIDAIIATEISTWNAHDAKAFSVHFAEDGSFTNIIGTTTFGRPAFEATHQRIFSTIYKDSSLALDISRLKFLRPDVAVLDLDAHLSGFTRLPPGIQPEPDGRFHCKLQMVLTKDNGAWWIATFHNVGVIPMPPAK